MNPYDADDIEQTIFVDDWEKMKLKKEELLRFMEALQATLARQNQMMIEATRHDYMSKHITQETAIRQLLTYGLNNLQIVELFEQWDLLDKPTTI